MSSSTYTDLIKSGVDDYERSSSAGTGSLRNMSLCLSDRIAAGGGSGGIPKFKTLPPPSLPLSSPASSSSYFAIPPGLSPADLLDSPVLLSSSSVLPSPTTGAIAAQSLKWKPNTSTNNVNHNNSSSSNEQDVTNYSDFTFQTQPPPSHVPSSIFHSSSIPSFPSLSVCLMSPSQKQQHQLQPECWWNSREHSNQNESASSIKAMVKTEFPTSHSQALGLNDNHSSNQIHNPNPINYQPLSQQYGSGNGSASSGRENKRSSEDDGFNWRKYGQKQVKGSENPRSYYKCTYPNCPMKKKIERSLDGHITEIVYKGSHNHPKPVHPRRSSSASASFSFQAASLPFQDPEPCLLPLPQGPGSSGSAQTDSVATPDNSSISVVDDDGLDMASHRSRSAVDDFDDHDDAPDAKRWKADQGDSECMSAAPRTGAAREPRVVVQTTSDIDILDDGYRWRKYGQKVVKGNPNPRSYYKCTHPGCPVRKHVERAAHDLRAVITTYEGKHNHDVPAARGSGSNRALPSGTGTAPSNSNYYGNPVPNQFLSNQRLATSTTVQVSSSPFEMLQNHDGSFGFSSAFINPPPQYPDNMFAPSRTKDEPKDDLFLESALLNIEY